MIDEVLLRIEITKLTAFLNDKINCLKIEVHELREKVVQLEKEGVS